MKKLMLFLNKKLSLKLCLVLIPFCLRRLSTGNLFDFPSTSSKQVLDQMRIVVIRKKKTSFEEKRSFIDLQSKPVAKSDL